MARTGVRDASNWAFTTFRWRVMKDQSDRTPDGDVNPGGSASPNFGAGGSRRRFIKGGAAAAPVILTFTSRPVLGFEQACMSPSRMISGNHSGFRGPDSCGGTSLSAYKTSAGGNLGNPGNRGNPGNSGNPGNHGNPKPSWYNDKFTVVFGEANPYISLTGNVQDKLGEVFLDSYDGQDATARNSTAQFAAYIIAAYLNSYNEIGSVGTVLKPAQVIHMWNDVIAGGGFCPQAGMCWTAIGVIGYLTNSGIVPE